jgi:two-component system, sensor histidine kinase and response regulator
MTSTLAKTGEALTRVLLIEDNPDDACLLREALDEAKEQIQLVHVGQLEDAAKLLGQESFQIILLDLSLPDSQGIETLVRVQGQAPSAPIVVLTGLDDDNIALQAVRAGAQDYLVKGEIDARNLLRAIRYASERKQAYEEMARLAADLTRANKAKDEFLNVMSHELRTPLSIVLGYSSMLREEQLGPLTEGQEQGMSVIQRNSKELLTMIDSMMDAVKLESGSMILEEESVSPVELLADMKLTYGLPTDKNIHLEWNVSDMLPLLWTDARKLRQILTNLIDNAIKFTDEGSIVISAEANLVADDGCDGRCIDFSISDNGIGIPPEECDNIFNRFYQVDSSATRSFEGVGLGLYIVKSFTEMLNGRVSVSSEVGNGSTFTVQIPCNSCQLESAACPRQ